MKISVDTSLLACDRPSTEEDVERAVQRIVVRRMEARAPLGSPQSAPEISLSAMRPLVSAIPTFTLARQMKTIA